MLPGDLHRWDVTPAEARTIQEDLRRRVRRDDAFDPADIRRVAGVDCGYLGRGSARIAFAAAVVVALPSLEVAESTVVSASVTFPYVPGLLSFRETPPMVEAIQALESAPHVLLCDAHGYAHPRRFGAASHLGLVLGIPSVGCAKSRLIGHYEEPAREFGARTPLIDGGEIIGAVVRTRPSAAPLFVSSGHMVSLETAVELVLACCRPGARLPVPSRLAHTLVTEHRDAARREVETQR